MEALVQTRHIQKSFNGVKALNDISIDFYPGRVHVLLGENGAGKSTLIKIISGVYQYDEGQIFLAGREIKPRTPREGIDLGISVIHQELSVVGDLSVAENIYLDNFPQKQKGVIDYKKMYQDTRELMQRLQITNMSPNTLVRHLSAADRQMVEIMRAISRNAKMVVMDEPTSSLSSKEVETLFTVINTLKQENVAVVYISHKMSEIFEVGDDISIFKDGSLVCTKLVSELDERTMVKLMVGREVGDYYIRAEKPKEKIPVLEVKNLTGEGFEDISFTLHKGEVLGFAGLIGAGRTEVMRAIFGADPIKSGEVYVKGERLEARHPQNSIAKGIALVPEDRRKQGVLLDATVRDNISIVSLKRKAKGSLIDFAWEKETAAGYIKKLKIKTSGDLAKVRNLSGGNQQKVVLAKWLAQESDILILDEPTRGIDVNAKAEIYRLIRGYVEQGGSVILVSSELPEVIGVSQRVAVMRAGRLAGILNEDELEEETIMRYAALENTDEGVASE